MFPDELLAMVTEVVSAKAEAMPGAPELVATAVPVAVAGNSLRALTTWKPLWLEALATRLLPPA
ncbi:hypothetical protein ATK30_2391 [Amycolatopsis echigonensis]|uniref:Uncharacterized protein n=2 Tax=Amycolatopsis echigonensis TaxID=2576905 RepID=A0A2N3WCL1_9PSEU|nr:hypothetical protein ATK30_2391 [Amycolatopsis niigatensis]